jgi:hypothetical protein
MKNRFIARLWIAVTVGAVLTAMSASDGRAEEPCPVGQFRGQYFKGGKRVFATCEKRIDFDWGTDGPRRGSNSGDDKSDSLGSLAVGVDDFGARWTGRFNFNGGNYTFIVIADDGVKVTVDGQLLIDEWRSQQATEFHATKHLTPGEHVVDVEYFEDRDEATIKVRWVRSEP